MSRIILDVIPSGERLLKKLGIEGNPLEVFIIVSEMKMLLKIKKEKVLVFNLGGKEEFLKIKLFCEEFDDHLGGITVVKPGLFLSDGNEVFRNKPELVCYLSR